MSHMYSYLVCSACFKLQFQVCEAVVFIYNLICKDTIDEVTKEAVESKQALSDYVVDDKLDDFIADKLRKYLLDL